MDLYPFLFEPNLHKVVWGGHRLRPYKGLPPSSDPIGESWEVSAVPSSPSVIRNGEWQGLDLISVIRAHPEAILGHKVSETYHGQLPLLVKFIDARDDLSIQVHPNDEMAQRLHGKMGKSEMWYIIQAEEGAHLYAGFKASITPDEYQRRIADGTITEVLADHPVKAGDVFYLPAGRVHAICGGILLAEVQQSSDVTYRIYDYGRPGIDGKPRALHTDLAAQALDFHVEANYRTEYVDPANRAVQVIDTPYFDVRVMEVSRPFHRDLRKYDSFVISMCLEGACTLRMRPTGDEVLLQSAHSVLIPAAIADYDILPLPSGSSATSGSSRSSGISGFSGSSRSSGSVRLLDAFIDNHPDPFALFTRFLHISS